MRNHPFSIFEGVYEGIACLDLRAIFKGELVDSYIDEEEEKYKCVNLTQSDNLNTM